MLGKLLKYEFLATARVMLPLYGGAIVIALLMRLLSFLEPAGVDTYMFGAAFGMLTFIYVMSILAVVVLTIVFIIQRFYSNLFKDQGYLTHTLPISVDTLLWSKLLSAFCWTVAGIVVFTISISLMASGFGHQFFFGFDFRQDLWQSFPFQGGPRGLDWILSLLHGLSSLLTSILMFYTALSIGQLTKRAKILIAILVYLGINFALSMISATFLGIFWASGSAAAALSATVYFTQIFTLAQGVGFYFITRGILRHKLNLE